MDVETGKDLYLSLVSVSVVVVDVSVGWRVSNVGLLL